MQQVEEFLKSKGFLAYEEKDPLYRRKVLYQRRIEDVTPVCACNDHLNLNVRMYDYVTGSRPVTSAEVSISGQRPDQEWTNLSIYNVSIDSLPEKLEAFERQLVAAWEAACALIPPAEDPK